LNLAGIARSAAHFKEKAHRQKRRWAFAEIKSGRWNLNSVPKNLRILGVGTHQSGKNRISVKPISITHPRIQRPIFSLVAGYARRPLIG
jgi:hypothetical protein